MADRQDPTIEKTQWTDTLLEDLCAALKGARDDATVRAFARELMDDKGLPIGYLVRKVTELVGEAEAARLEVLIRGRHAVDREKAARAKAQGGLRGLLRRLLG